MSCNFQLSIFRSCRFATLQYLSRIFRSCIFTPLRPSTNRLAYSLELMSCGPRIHDPLDFFSSDSNNSQDTKLPSQHHALCSQSDEHLYFSDLITSLSKSCNFYIRQLRCIRPFLDIKTASTIATSIVHSKLDYCNSLYYNLPNSQLSRLQHIQSSLARAVLKLPSPLISLLLSNLSTG